MKLLSLWHMLESFQKIDSLIMLTYLQNLGGSIHESAINCSNGARYRLVIKL